MEVTKRQGIHVHCISHSLHLRLTDYGAEVRTAATTGSARHVAWRASERIERRTLDSLAKSRFNLTFEGVEPCVIVNLAFQHIDFGVLCHKGHIAVIQGIGELLDTQVGKSLILIADNSPECGFKLLFENGGLLTGGILEVEDVAFDLIAVTSLTAFEGHKVGKCGRLHSGIESSVHGDKRYATTVVTPTVTKEAIAAATAEDTEKEQEGQEQPASRKTRRHVRVSHNKTSHWLEG